MSRPVSNEFLSSVASSLRAGLGGGASGAAGMPTGAIAQGYPANATQNEIKIWDHTQRAFGNEEVRLKGVQCSAVLVFPPYYCNIATVCLSSSPSLI